jgi:hypothetical protein
MPDLGKKYTCYSCHTKFYDLGKPVPLCPKCGADQRDAEDTPAVTPARSRRVVVEEPVEETDFAADDPAPAGPAGEADEEEETFGPAEREEEEEEEEEEY